jgi:hypothetical protein
MSLGNNNKNIVKNEIIVKHLRFSCEPQGAR